MLLVTVVFVSWVATASTSLDGKPACCKSKTENCKDTTKHCLDKKMDKKCCDKTKKMQNLVVKTKKNQKVVVVKIKQLNNIKKAV